MKYCSTCGKEILNEAIICPGCGCATESHKNKLFVEDKVSVGLCVLAFFIPLFGIIYWPIKNDETPKKAKACGITAIISAAIPIMFFIFYTILFIITDGFYY